MKQPFFLFSLSACLALTSLPALAAVEPVADYTPGHTLSAGIVGLSYDHTFPGLSAGASLNGGTGNTTNPQLTFALRAASRFLQRDGLSAAFLGGVHYDPGTPGSRAYLIPDLGIGLAYGFQFVGLPLTLRLNVTLSSSDRRNYPYSGIGYAPAPPSPGMDVQPKPNFFQSLTTGPNTALSLAYRSSDAVEITLGGATLVGIRLKY